MCIRITHDKLITISVADTRKETSWKSKDILWSELLVKFSVPFRTAETHEQYMKMTKDRQQEIKDVGGFVGGGLVGGKRKKHSVSFRSLVTLDVDFPAGDVWEDYVMMYHQAGAIYSTHKHSSESPRLRLVVPLDREVMADEYQAIARRIAGYLNIEVFDRSTFQPERMMFWPSTSTDGEFDFRYQDGPILSADEVLKSYRDWTDVSFWPTSNRDHTDIVKTAQKQGDPESKPGLVGAFCRTYSIEEAISIFLTDVYEECDVPNRYTYKHGSTSAGMILYEDKFAYSHHGTDPISGKLCNAFDLVRIHLFGLQDEDVAAGCPVNKLPSYIAMCDMVAADANVKLLIGRERQQRAADDFDFFDTASTTQVSEDGEIVANDSWLSKLESDRKGNYKQTIHNVSIILRYDPLLRGCFGWNLFANRKAILRDLPWRKIGDENYIKDSDEANLRKYLERAYEITARSVIADALETEFELNAFHPVRDYLNGVSWDGKERLDSLLIKYLGAEDTPYTRQVTRKTLVAAVARIMQPGIKFDYMLTLSGPEGVGKSTLIRKLGGAWFSDSFTTVEGTKAMEQVQGCWLIEAGEMKALKKAEVQSVKHFIAKQEDIYRPAYGHNVIYPKRQCIFIGTTNEVEPLKGENGDRRFWIVMCCVNPTEANIRAEHSLSEAERAQLWAEAVHLFKQGEKIYLDDSMELVAKEIQKNHAEQDDRLGMILEYLDRKLPADWEAMSILERRAWLNDPDPINPGVIIRERFCIAELWVEALDNKRETINRYNTRDIYNLVNKIDGWARGRKERFGKQYGPQQSFDRINISSLKTHTHGTEDFIN